MHGTNSYDPPMARKPFSMPSDIQSFFHRDLVLRVADRRLPLAVSQELFSSHTIDTGTLLLIKQMERQLSSGVDHVLDLGSGYGPVALAAATLSPEARVSAVDRDALAVRYTKFNADQNAIMIDSKGSLGFDDIEPEGQFDLLLSNVPGKGGPLFHESLLLGSTTRLRRDAMAMVVVVNPLVARFEAWERHGRIEIVERVVGAEHTVLTYRLRPDQGVPEPGYPRAYDRQEMFVNAHGVRYNLPTVYGLPEFNELAYHTELVLQSLPKGRRDCQALVWNPGQGHVVAALVSSNEVRHVDLFDRDLLALRAARGCGFRAGVETTVSHVTGLDGATLVRQGDVAVAILRSKEPPQVHEKGIGALLASTRSSGCVLVAGRTLQVRRAVANVLRSNGGNYRVDGERSKRGHLCLRIRVRDVSSVV